MRIANLYSGLLRCQEIHLLHQQLSNAVYISCIIDNNWAIHDSPGRKSDC